MIKLKSGVYGAASGLVRANGIPFTLTQAEEERLIRRGVAEWVYAADSMGECDDAGREENTVEARFAPENLGSMSRTNLEQLAEELNVDVSKCRNKANVVEKLNYALSAQAEACDSEELPCLEAEAPVT